MDTPDPHLGAVPDRLGPHVFVADIDAPELDGADRHHLEGPLRTRPGDPLTICDGKGSWREARFDDAIEVTGPVTSEPLREPQITVAFAPIKGDRSDLVVQKLTELGVDAIIPIVTEHGVVRWDRERASRQVARFRRIAREASMQCRRCRLPRIDELTPFAEVVVMPGAVMADRGGGAPSLERTLVLVGPEGGWSGSERAMARCTMGIADNVLRAETASIAAASLLVALRNGLVG